MEIPPLSVASSTTLCTGLCSSAGRNFAGKDTKEHLVTSYRDYLLNINSVFLMLLLKKIYWQTKQS